MKKNILIIFIIFAFAMGSFGYVLKPAKKFNQTELFIKNQLKLLGLVSGKITKSGDGFIIIVNGYTPKTKALTRTAPFTRFSMKVKLKSTAPRKKSIIDDNKQTRTVIIVNNRNTKLIISKIQLLGANFIVDDNDMPTGIIIAN